MKEFRATSMAALIGTLAASAIVLPVAADTSTNPFAMQQLDSGYLQLAEGKCGADKSGKSEGKCGADKSAKAEGKCGADKSAKAEGKCGADKSAKATKAEGKCGEGKCGGAK